MATNNEKIKLSSKFLRSFYEDLGYSDLYAGSILIVVVLTLGVIMTVIYCQVMQRRQVIVDDWTNQRCHPSIIPFAGFINRPPHMTISGYTQQNFQFCMQNNLANVTSFILQPFQWLMKSLTSMYAKIAEAINASRSIVANMRNGMATIAISVFQRTMNVLIPLQKIIMALMDSFGKTQSILVAGLYTALGSYNTLQSLLGSIVEIIIKILSIMVVIIIGLWTVPFSWPAASAMSAVFLAIAVPLSIIVTFMTEVLHINSPAIPKLRCFDEDTTLTLNDGYTRKRICDLVPGDQLQSDGYITATIKVTSTNIDMFSLDGIVVSGNHIVIHKGRAIPVTSHPSRS
jgi:hypothetical protein